MYYKLKDAEVRMIKEIEEITVTDYNVSCSVIGNVIPVDNLLSIIEDLQLEVESLNRKLEEKNNMDFI